MAPLSKDRELPVDATLKRIVVLFRLLGWAWMALLVALTPGGDPGADRTIMFGALALASAWTGLTLWAALRSGRLGDLWFTVADVAIALLVGAASTLAGAENLFHGGYPMSALAVVAYAANLRITIGASGLLAIEQVIVHAVDDRGRVPAAGSVTFLVFGTLLGWGFDAVRNQERQRLATQAALDHSRAAEVRHQERLDIANRLHDSVLQTLGAMRRDADDAEQIRYLARQQERQLRRTISEYRSPYENSARAALLGLCDDVEDLHRVEVDAVVRGDAMLDDVSQAMLAATREAITNAAKHSGADVIDVYAEFAPGTLRIFVRDKGRGFDPQAAGVGRGLDHGVRQRLVAIGGAAEIRTEPAQGTDVELIWPAP